MKHSVFVAPHFALW